MTSYEDDEATRLEQRLAETLLPIFDAPPLLPVAERVRAGLHLDLLGDPRRGVATLEPDWCDVPAGPFLLGSDDTSSESRYDGKPQHTVDLPGFRISRYPVTNAQWRLFMQDGGYRARRWWSDAGWTFLQPGGHGQDWSFADNAQPIVQPSD